MKAHDQESVTHVVQVFKMLSDQHRLHLLVLLAHQGELSVSALCQATGQARHAIRHRLTQLCMAGFVGSRRRGPHTLYWVCDEVVRQVLTFVQP